MKLPLFPRYLSGFLAAFALGFWVLSWIPAPYGLLVGLGFLWTAGAAAAGWKLFRWEVLSGTPAPGPAAEAVTVPEPGEPGADLGSETAVPGPVTVPEPVTVLDRVTLPSEPPPFPVEEWREVLNLVEADWNRADDLGPSLETFLGNTAFIRENIIKAYEIADNLAGSAQHAFTLSEKVQKGIKVVTDALLESLKQTEVLSIHSERITGILELLEEVSDKIHVLSINASIVSARAGVSGRGFEVVAKEIRSLAKETEHSLGDIVEVIDLFRSSIGRVIQVVRDADLETEHEKDSLIEVAGALQGVILGVEIVKAVSGFAREKSLEQEGLIKGMAARDRGPSPGVKEKLGAAKARLDEWKTKE